MKLKEAIELIKENKVDSIDLENRQIGATGAKALAKTLKKNDTLILLFLDNHDLFQDNRILGVNK